MFLNLTNFWYFMINGKVIWDILQLMNKFWKVISKFFGSNGINKTCWIEMFSEMIKDFLRGAFPRSFKVDSCFVAREKSLSSSLIDRRLIDLSSFCFKIFIFLKKLVRSLILSRVFDSSLELAFLAFSKLFIFWYDIILPWMA